MQHSYRIGVLALLCVSALWIPSSHAQVHFDTCLDGTGNINEATFFIPTTSSPNIDGLPLPAGSEIAIFSSDAGFPDLCVGLATWNGTNTYITVWGDDDQTPQRDGLLTDEQVLYRVWDSATSTEYAGASISVSYASGDSLYGANKISVLGALTVLVPQAPPAAPTLDSPADGTTDVPINTTLQWNAVAGADTYWLQLALASDPLFTTPLVDEATLTDISYYVAGLDFSTEYHWRVSASNAEGSSDWSSPFSFTTEADVTPILLTLKKVFLNNKGIKVATLKWPSAEVATNKVDVYQDGVFVKRTGNDGKHKQKIYAPGDGPFMLRICEKYSTTVCSNEVAADFTGASVMLLDDEEDVGHGARADSLRASPAGEPATAAANKSALELPDDVYLYDNYPNPFNDATTLTFALPQATEVTMTVYDVLGKVVATLISGTLPAGRHAIRWEAHDVPSGLYLGHLQAGGRMRVRPLTVVK